MHQPGAPAPGRGRSPRPEPRSGAMQQPGAPAPGRHAPGKTRLGSRPQGDGRSEMRRPASCHAGQNVGFGRNPMEDGHSRPSCCGRAGVPVLQEGKHLAPTWIVCTPQDSKMGFGYLARRAGPGGKVTPGARVRSRLKAERRARPLETQPPTNGGEGFGGNLAAGGLVTGAGCGIRPPAGPSSRSGGS